MIASHTTIIVTYDNTLSIDIPMKANSVISNHVVFEENSLIYYGVVILKGVTICKDALLEAMALMTKDYPSNTIVGGVSAKVIKYRNDEERTGRAAANLPA